VEGEWHVTGRASRVVIFLSPFDVHVNRAPVDARLVGRRREAGRALPAFLVAGAGANARQLLAFDGETPSGQTVPFVIVQVVGFLVRRIVTWRWPGETVHAGDRLGMLRFGSRTDLVLPAGTADILVTRGQRVFAAVTPVARFR
jgi:phosphatidylserine decarboxylase